MKAALVIGGTGFIGLNLVDALVERGVAVRVTRRRRSITAFVRKRPVELVEASLDSEESLVRAMQGCNVAFLAGAHYPRYSLDRERSIAEGLHGVRNACRAAQRVPGMRLVYTSSLASLAEPAPGAVADERDIPAQSPTDSVYRAVKWHMEREVDRAVQAGCNVVTLLPGACLGPWDARLGTGGVMVATVRGLLPWRVEGLVHVCDVGDVAAAHIAAAERSPAGACYCLGGHSVPLGVLLERIVQRYGGRVPERCLEPDHARTQADADEWRAAPKRERVPWPRELVDMVLTGTPVSSRRAMDELAYRPTALEATLDRAHAWYRQYGYLPETTHERRRSYARE